MKRPCLGGRSEKGCRHVMREKGTFKTKVLQKKAA